MNPIRARAEAALAFCPAAFLRCDRQSALFVTDLPSRCPEAAFDGGGFRAERRGALLALTPDDNWMAEASAWAHERAEPSELFRLLGRFERGDVLPGGRALWIEGLKLVERGNAASRSAYERRLRQLAAVCLRTGVPDGALPHCAALLDCLIGGK